jgi:hypothetical protein
VIQSCQYRLEPQHRSARGGRALWFQRDRPQCAVGDILKRDGERFGVAVNRDVTEELQSEARREVVAQILGRGLLERDPRSKRAIKLDRRPGAGVERTGNEFPERLEIRKYGAVRIVIM